MDSQKVLILGHHARRELSLALERLGFTPEVRGSMMNCLKMLKSMHAAAVVMDCDFTHADELEFLLNVRDIDGAVTVVMVGRHQTEVIEQAVLSHRNTFWIDRHGTTPEMTEQLAPLLSKSTA